jgi:hypothetical protein
MAKMIVKAIKLTEDIESIKIAYEKHGKLYIRNGNDGFTTGNATQGDLSSLGKWGFRKVDPNPQFRDAEEIIDNLDKFSLDNTGVVKYHG